MQLLYQTMFPIKCHMSVSVSATHVEFEIRTAFALLGILHITLFTFFFFAHLVTYKAPIKKN